MKSVHTFLLRETGVSVVEIVLLENLKGILKIEYNDKRYSEGIWWWL